MGYRAAGTNLAHKLKSKRTARIGGVILVGGMLALITEAQFEPIEATVVRVIDGDTIRVRVQGKEHTVRLIGVDTRRRYTRPRPCSTLGRRPAPLQRRRYLEEHAQLRAE